MGDRSELIREVYAQFGLAYYLSEVVHRNLCIYFSLAGFNDPEIVTRPRIEESLKYASSRTLGQIIKETKDYFPLNIQEQLDQVLERRNYLAHHFWYERIHKMFDENGLHQLLYELDEFAKLFLRMDDSISEYSQQLNKKFGISPEIIHEAEKLCLDGKDEPLIEQRLPKKQERIVKVWDVTVNDDLIVQIFETDDGIFWQLSDLGLGWTRFNEPDENWKINKSIQQFLPASIKPRPSVLEPWNYEFHLARGAILWIKRGKRERSYTWGVKEPKI